MNKTNTCTLSALLAAASVLVMCASCGAETQPKNENSTLPGTEAAGTEEGEMLPDPFLHGGLEERDLGGYELKILGRYANSSFIETGIYATELNGEVVNDLVFERNQELMKRFGCNITFEHQPDDQQELQSILQQTIQAGDDVYQLVLFTPSHFCGLAGKNMLVDWSTLDDVQLGEPWWDQNVNSALRIGDYQYAVYGSALFNLKLKIYHVIFNKEIAAKYDVSSEELYESARNGTWTLDRLGSLAKLVKEDLNGDGKYDNNDVWGCMGESYTSYTLALGAGAEFLTEQPDGRLLVTADSERTTEACMKVLSLFTDKEHYLITENMKGVPDIWSEMYNMEQSSKIFLLLGTLRDSLRDMEADYGILPSPKLDENQAEYRHTTTVINAPVLAIPVTAAQPEMTAYLMELMQYQAHNDILPVYYQNFLNTKMVRDEESVEMLKLIHGTLFIDRCALYTFDFVGMIQDNAKTAKERYASDIAKRVKGVQNMIDKAMEAN